MQFSGIPSKFAMPWGENAASGTIRAIPPASQIGITAGAASLNDGFPPVTLLPVGAGGTPPFAQDMNGILNQITAWSQWQQAGGPVTYDAAFQAAVGGYPNGSVVNSATTFGVIWLCTADNNVTNPDTGGAGWVSGGGQGRLLNIQYFFTAGTFTYTPTPGATSAVIQGQGGGGAGGGVPGTTGYSAAGGGGQAGSLGIKRITGGLSSQTVTIGAAGAGSAGAIGGTGGATSFGALMTMPGGAGGGVGVVAAGPASLGVIYTGSSPSGGDEMTLGALGFYGINFSSGSATGGNGGHGPFGMGGSPNGISATGYSAGHAASGNGAGGGGAAAVNSATAAAGGDGTPGWITVYEYA